MRSTGRLADARERLPRHSRGGEADVATHYSLITGLPRAKALVTTMRYIVRIIEKRRLLNSGTYSQTIKFYKANQQFYGKLFIERFEMYTLTLSQNGKTTTKILEADFDFNELSLLNDVDDELPDKNQLKLPGELISTIMQSINQNESVEELVTKYTLSNFEIEFIAKLVGKIDTYAYLVKYFDVCGKSSVENVGFWLKNSDNKWVAVERFCDGEIIMGYIKPGEIMQYLVQIKEFVQ